MSDGLTVLENEKGGYDRVSENTNKIRRINDRVMIGSTGNVDLRDRVLDFCFPKNNTTLLNSITAEIATQSILQSMQQIQHIKEQVNFVIAGINSAGRIQMDSIEDSGKLKHQIAEGGDIDITTLSPKTKNAFPIFYRKILSAKDTPIIEVMRQTIFVVAQADPTVNTNTFFQYIHR